MKSLKDRAVDLRRRGWSYNIIAKRLGVGKSTLSDWLRTIPYEPNQVVIRRIRSGPAKAAASKQRRVLQQITRLRDEARQEIGTMSKRDLFFLGLGLYMGEGSKLYENIRLINSNPDLVRVAMKWFRDVCEVPERNFAIVLHLYPDSSPRAARRFWSRVAGVSTRQFEKVQIDQRTDKSPKKRRRLPYGTAHIKVYGRGDQRFGVALHRRIMGWTSAVYETICGRSLVVKPLPSKEESRVRFPSPAYTIPKFVIKSLDNR